ncbi:MAG: hypothetical protein AAF517_02930, partial [Planctomycetota bacterium]
MRRNVHIFSFVLLTVLGSTCGASPKLLAQESTFVRGDANLDGRVDLSDSVRILGFLFLGSERPACMKAADTEDSGSVSLNDAIYLVNFLFLGGARPIQPYPD